MMVANKSPGHCYWEVKPTTLQTLLEHVDNQLLALPQFQRDYRWTSKDSVPFICSILQNKVTGSLLILNVRPGEQAYAPREIKRGPLYDSDKLTYLLLDGQQRTTTLYHAFRVGFMKGNNKVPFMAQIDILELLSESTLLEEHIKIDQKMGSTPEEQAGAGRLGLPLLLNRKERDRWIAKFENHPEMIKRDWGREEILDALESRFEMFMKLDDYRFPTTILEEGTPPSVIVDLFSNINRRGRKLDEFELMVARCFNEQEPSSPDPYDLLKHWGDAFRKTKYLKKIGISETSRLLPLYLIACALKRETNVLGSLPIGADAVLTMDPKFVTGKSLRGNTYSLEAAVDALEKAAKFLHDQCGVLHSVLMPQEMMILPIADQFFLESKLRPRLKDDLMKKWFWISGLRGDFYGSTMSYVAKGCNDLEAWSKSSTAIPEAVRKFNKSSITSLNLLEAKRRRGDIVGKTLLAMLAQSGSADWKKNNGTLQHQVSVAGASVQAHHIIPEKSLLRFFKLEEPDDRTAVIANFAATSQNANGALGDKEPTGVKTELGADYESILNLSLVPRAQFEKVSNQSTFRVFIEAREKMLKRKIEDMLL